MLTRPPYRGAGSCRPASGDDGFTMIETIVAIAVVMVIMAALTQYFTQTMRINHQQGDKQIAVQLADGAMERVHALKTAAILTGRDKKSVQDQEKSPVPAVASMLSSGFADLAYDSGAADGAGATAVLPTSPLETTLNGLTYKQYFYIDNCERATGASTECVAKVTGKAGTIPFYRVIIAVTWPNGLCNSDTCSYVTSTLIGSKYDEPVFNTNTGASVLDITDPPATVYNDTGIAVNFQPSYTGGAAPLAWTVTGLPAGLALNALTGAVTGTPTAATGTSYTTQITATDVYDQQDYIKFTWKLTTVPTWTVPTATYSTVGAAATKTITQSNGAQPITWTVTNLPPGIARDASTTGSTVLSGTPTSVGTWTVGVTAVDNSGQTLTGSFVWTTALTVTYTLPSTTKVNTAIAGVQPAATGGVTPYLTWSATGLPTGLSINSLTGAISGTPTLKGTYNVTVTVTDTSLATASKSTTWTVS